MKIQTPLVIKKEYPFTKVGVNEVMGLKPLMRELMAPVQQAIKDKICWSDVELAESEYVGRDGFIPHSDNCGGIELCEIIPPGESYEFEFLEFGTCDECEELSKAGTLNKDGDIAYCGYHGQECASESEGHLSAKLRIWFKFEGVDDDGVMSFWLYLGGGNGDAPYFRTKYESDVFEVSFTAKSLKELKTKAPRHIKSLLKAMK